MMLAILNLGLVLNIALYETTAQANAKQILSTTCEVITRDLKLAGLRASPAFTAISSTSMTYSGDINDGGVPKTMQIYGTYNASTQLWKLYRTVNGGSLMLIGSDLVSIQFTYYDVNGTVTATAANVISVEITLTSKFYSTAELRGESSALSRTTKQVIRVYPLNL
ncbi:MAG: hypothetical protein V1799_14785 [bacterium]